LADHAAPFPLQEQFATPEQQQEVAIFGMWIFLVTELMLFGGLFTAFAVYRSRFGEAFTAGSGQLSFWMGAVNTLLILCSSLTMTLAAAYARIGRQWRSAVWLAATMLLGVLFLGVKFAEWIEHAHEGKVPGHGFHAEGFAAAHVELFFVFYFVLTALHALHMMIGLGLLGTSLVQTARGVYLSRYATPVLLSGLYWHFVDIIWLFLFAILYIPGEHLR
jgi:cytochrome c oxidase subunit III